MRTKINNSISRIGRLIRKVVFVLALAVLATLQSCDTQSYDARYADDFSVVLYNVFPESELAWTFDGWVTGDYPSHDDDIYEADHKAVVQIKSNGEPLQISGIRVDVEVVDHGNMDIGIDIWNDYGYVALMDSDGWKIEHLDVGDNPLTGRSTPFGQCTIAVVFTGDVDAFLDENWNPYAGALLPDDWITTWVELKITIIRRGHPIREIYVWSTFQRVGLYQHFWGQGGSIPVEGVIDISSSGIGTWDKSAKSVKTVDPNDVEVLAPEDLSDLPEDERFAPIPLRSRINDLPAPSSVLSRFESESKSAEKSASSGLTVDWTILDQLIYHPLYGWVWASNIESPIELHVMWFETTDPDEITQMMDYLQPYAFWSQVSFPEPTEPHMTTTVLTSIDPNDGVALQMYLRHISYACSPDKKTHLVHSDYFGFLDNPQDPGYYYDSGDPNGNYKNLYVMTYYPENGHVKVEASNGDFNLDTIVNLSDFSIMADRWQYAAADSSSRYNGFFENAENLTGVVGIESVRWLGNRWLEKNPPYPDPNFNP